MQSSRFVHVPVCAALPLLIATLASAAPIVVPNGTFEEMGVLDPNDGGDWSSENPGGAFPGPGISDELDNNDQFWSAGTGNARWGTGWSTDSTTAGGWGLNHPDWGQFRHQTAVSPFHMNQLFGGYFIGHMNIADGQGAVTKYTQSASLGQVQAGTYTARVAVAMKAGVGWNDIEYRLGLVSGGTAEAGFGSTGGTLLGDAVQVMRTADGSDINTNEEWLTFVLNVPEGHNLLGTDLAIRITGTNLGTIDGVAAPTGTAAFTQATFDNVTLDFVAIPEPSSLALIGLAGFVLHRRGRRPVRREV